MADENQIEKRQSTVAMTKNGLMPTTMEEAWRYATALSKTVFVPQTYQGKPEDCLIAIDMACRLQVAPLMLLQNTYVVYGRPNMEAKLVIALVNNSGLFTDPLEYQVVGDDPTKKNYQVRAFATRAKTGKVVYGPWITWDVVDKEGWSKKPGSKWLTMPGLMFAYRAASWFCNMYCPEVKMGMSTTEEIADMTIEGGVIPVESKTLEPTNGRQPFGFQTPPAGQHEGAPDQGGEDETKKRHCPFCDADKSGQFHRMYGKLGCHDCWLADNGTTESTQEQTTDPQNGPGPGQEGEDTDDAGTESPQDATEAGTPPAPVDEPAPDQLCICSNKHEFKYELAVMTENGKVCPHCNAFFVMSEPEQPKAKRSVLKCSKGHTMMRNSVIASPLAKAERGEVGVCPECKAAGVATLVKEA